MISGRQKQGIGEGLASEDIERCRSIGCSVIAVLGDPAYYTQFGFTRAAAFGLGNEYQAGDEFMVIELAQGVSENFTGIPRIQGNWRLKSHLNHR